MLKDEVEQDNVAVWLSAGCHQRACGNSHGDRYACAPNLLLEGVHVSMSDIQPTCVSVRSIDQTEGCCPRCDQEAVKENWY